MSNPLITLEERYRSIESRLLVESAPEYAHLVVANRNVEEPIHRWFHLKEAFSSRLFRQVLKDACLDGKPDLRVLDPYAGVGTTLVSVAEAVRNNELRTGCAYGIEQNPFLRLVAYAKLLALQHPPQQFGGFAGRILALTLASRTRPDLPALSTFHNADYFDAEDVRQLGRMRESIDHLEADGADASSVALARVCLGAIVEAVSNLRRDGRALRYTPKGRRPAPGQAFQDKAQQIAQDIATSPTNIEGRVILGDGRRLEGIDGRLEPFDVVMFSPPYPNNIDYTEVYKLENWALGYLDSERAFWEQRLRTVYSHPSVLRDDPLPCEDLNDAEAAAIVSATECIVAAIPDDRYRSGRYRMVRGYALDMFLTLRGCAQRVSNDGVVVYVVGNSAHGRVPHEFVIAADLLLAELAEAVGLSVERIAIARQLRRRGESGRFLRESVVFLRRAGMAPP